MGKTTTIISRPEVNCKIDYYSWIQGEDKHMHKIGICDGSATIEKVDDQILRLLDSEAQYYNKIIHSSLF